MIGDSKLFLKIHREKANLIIQKILEVLVNPGYEIFSIGGESGTGKTEVAELVQQILFEKYKIKSFVIHLDDYYKSDFHNRDEIRKKTRIIGRDELNWKKLNKIASDFLRKEPKIYIQMIHRWIDKIIHAIVQTKGIDLLIFEGLYGCYLMRSQYNIYLEGGIKDTYEFRKKRGKENPDDEFRQRVLEIERNSIVQSKKLANFVIHFDLEGK